MAQASFKVSGVAIKLPHAFKQSKYKITDSNRTADGSMVMDLIARKRKFFFAYEAIEDYDWAIIESLLFDGDVFFPFEYMDDNVLKTATVYVGEMNKGDLVRTGGVWVWKGSTFNLIER